MILFHLKEVHILDLPKLIIASCYDSWLPWKKKKSQPSSRRIKDAHEEKQIKLVCFLSWVVVTWMFTFKNLLNCVFTFQKFSVYVLYFTIQKLFLRLKEINYEGRNFICHETHCLNLTWPELLYTMTGITREKLS